VVALEKPDVVVVWGGINDLGAARLPELVMGNLMKLFAMCEGIGAKPIACTLTPTSHTSPKMMRLNELIRAYTSEKGMALADLFSALADNAGNLRREYSDDGAHLTQDGYKNVAQIVFQAIAEKMEP
jgi:lysophospholipase L1-like esterase